MGYIFILIGRSENLKEGQIGQQFVENLEDLSITMPPLQRTTTAGGTTTCVCDSNAIVPVLDLVSGILSEIYILSDSCCRCPNFNSTSNPVYFYSCIHFLYHVLFSRPQFVFLASFHFLVVAAFISNLF